MPKHTQPEDLEDEQQVFDDQTPETDEALDTEGAISDRTPDDELSDENVQTSNEADTDEDVSPENEQKSDDPESFPREYVEQLRDESARYRQRAREADALAERLHTSLVAATGRLQDPSDLPFDQTHLDDTEALTAAVEDLLARKPHLASRRPAGDIGQGAGSLGGSVDLAGMLRARA